MNLLVATLAEFAFRILIALYEIIGLERVFFQICDRHLRSFNVVHCAKNQIPEQLEGTHDRYKKC